jgi:hypothetical protein
MAAERAARKSCVSSARPWINLATSFSVLLKLSAVTGSCFGFRRGCGDLARSGSVGFGDVLLLVMARLLSA